ncbi:MAG: OadG family transporter subunit [Bacteroidales bacterium]
MWWTSDINFDISAIYGEGLTIAIIGYLIVFVALLLSFLLFANLPRILYYRIRREHKKRIKGEHQGVKEEMHIPAEVTAAIATALYLHFSELHDRESNVITIQRVRKRYSPWSSKIYGLRRWPHKTF